MAVVTKRSVHVLNLPVYPLCEIEDLLFELFLQVGPVSKVFIPYNKEDGTHKGYGFVEFLHKESVPYACKMLHGIKLLGLYIGVNQAVSRAEKEHLASIKMEEETLTDTPNNTVQTPPLLEDHTPEPPTTSVTNLFTTPTMTTPPCPPPLGMFCPPFPPPHLMSTHLFPPPPIPPSFPPPLLPPSFSAPPMTLPTPPLPQATPPLPQQFFASPHSFTFVNPHHSAVTTPTNATPPTSLPTPCDIDTKNLMSLNNSNNNGGHTGGTCTPRPNSQSSLEPNNLLDFCSSNPFKLAAVILGKSRGHQPFEDSVEPKRLKIHEENRDDLGLTTPTIDDSAPPTLSIDYQHSTGNYSFAEDVVPRNFSTDITEDKLSFTTRKVFEYNHQSILDSPAPS